MIGSDTVERYGYILAPVFSLSFPRSLNNIKTCYDIDKPSTTYNVYVPLHLRMSTVASNDPILGVVLWNGTDIFWLQFFRVLA